MRCVLTDWCVWRRAMTVAGLLVGLLAGVADLIAARPGDPEAGSATVDLRSQFEKYGLTHRAQGPRGTCSVFTMTSAIEFAIARQRPHVERLSVEFLNWASNQATKDQNDGGFFSDLWTGYASYGICTEDEMPYAPQFDPARRPGEQTLERAGQLKSLGLELHWIKEWDPHQGLNEEQLAEVKETLRRGWPVCGGFLWPKREKWTDGVLNMPPRAAVRDGHSVLLVGYRDDPQKPGGGVFLLRNSGKGLDAGEMSYDYARAYMNDAAWVGSLAAPPSPAEQ